jgi:nitroimidazol reductase NimA-like FMN-containing flavoprotein (pyridoxamine 5'-phosphate oxidase superfamily)
MRRFEYEIKDQTEIDNIIRSAKVCRLGMSADDQPYIVPLCFGYEAGSLFFHSAGEGKKLDMLEVNSNVCFEFDLDHALNQAEKPCDWGMTYRSVIGFGTASVVDDIEAKRQGFDAIMRQYSDRSFTYPDGELKGTSIIKVQIHSMTGKKNGEF